MCGKRSHQINEAITRDVLDIQSCVKVEMKSVKLIQRQTCRRVSIDKAAPVSAFLMQPIKSFHFNLRSELQLQSQAAAGDHPAAG